MFLRFQTTDGVWHDYREFDKFGDSEIEKIKISDNGIGYDEKSLGVFASANDHKESSGKWGEGLKMLSAAAIRNGIYMELRSREWLAVPEIEAAVLNEGKGNEKNIQKLVYRLIKRVDKGSKILDDGDNAVNSDYGFTKEQEISSTTFVNPTPELIREFRNIRENVLLFDSRTPLTTVKNSDILATNGGRLYVKNILIPGRHDLKYSYHLKDFDIETRDRDVIKSDSMKKKIREILENVEDERFISDFLLDAVGYAQGIGFEQFHEFETGFRIPSETELADKWIRAFKYKFGDRASIRAVNDMNFDAFHQAQHMGLSMVTLPAPLANALKGLKGRDGQTIASYENSLNAAIENAVFIEDTDLTEKEQAMVNHLLTYNKILGVGLNGVEPITTIRVYDYPEDYYGEKAAGFAGYGNKMSIYRQTLNSGILEAGHVFFHESGHAVTGSEDASPAFRDYLSRMLSAVAARLLPLEDSIKDNGVATDVSISDINQLLDSLGKILSATEKAQDKLNDGEEFGEQ